MAYNNFAEAAHGLETRKIKKILGVRSMSEFNRELKRLLAVIEPLGITIRFVSAEDKWYLVAKTNHPPEDLHKNLLITLCVIYKLMIEEGVVSPEMVIHHRKLKEETVMKHLKELVDKKYLLIQDNYVHLTTKSKIRLKCNGVIKI